jgi:hypothetical protein
MSTRNCGLMPGEADVSPAFARLTPLPVKSTVIER